MSLSRSTVSIDETVDLILKIDDGGFPRAPALPLPDGLTELGQSNQRVTVNGDTEYSIRYTLKAEKTGEYQIGPFRLNTSNGSERVPAVTLTVTEATVFETNEDLFVTLESTAESALVRENIELTLTFYTRISIGDINVLDFPAEGFELSEWQQIRSSNKQVGQKIYRTQRFVARLTPTQAGEYLLNPTFRVNVMEVDNAFGMMFQTRSSRSVRLKLEEPLRLEITPPPIAGRPEDYSGHLGNFRLKADISPKEVRVGDPVTLRVELSGTGSLQQALPPGMKESEDFKVYQPRLITENMQRDGRTGRKITEQVIIPKHAEVSEVPALDFSYYDTQAREYKTIQTGPFPLTVIEGDGLQTTTSVSSLPSADGVQEIKVLGRDLVYLKNDPGRLVSFQSLQPGWTFTGLCTLPFCIWALTGFFVTQNQKKNSDGEALRRQKAPRGLRKQLKQLDENQGEVFGSIWMVLSEYISARLNLPPGESPSQDLINRLPDTITPETKQALANWITRCERALFAGAPPIADREKVLDDFRSLMLKLDKEWVS